MENDINEVIGVMEGDCSNTKALIEVMKNNNIKTYPFSYPQSHKLEDIKNSLDSFMKLFNVSSEDVENLRRNLNEIRNIAREIDIYTYKNNKVSGFENHLYQVSLSDFNGNPEEYKKVLSDKLEEIKSRKPTNKKIRLGFIGVPPMTCDIYDFVENFDAHFIYNEVQREFAFPRGHLAKNIYEQYYDYTYVYDLNFRLNEIKNQIQERNIDGIIHYTQAFCYRSIEDIVIKKELNIPVLNIEGDKTNSLDSRTKLRIEAFIDMLLDCKEGIF